MQYLRDGESEMMVGIHAGSAWILRMPYFRNVERGPLGAYGGRGNDVLCSAEPLDTAINHPPGAPIYPRSLELD